LKCQHCGENVDLPFKCPFCGGYFCADHRLPENHNCSELARVRARKPPVTKNNRQLEAEREAAPVYPVKFRKGLQTSSTEILHLAAATFIVMAVGLSMYGSGVSWIFMFFRNPFKSLVSGLVFAGVFICHELAHKWTANHYGLWAEFRLSLMGVAFTLISIASNLLKIVSPGAVMISGVANKKILGVIALAGPAISLTISCLLFSSYLFLPKSPYSLIALHGGFISAWIAILNLVPFSVLDGAKIMWWNKTVWAVVFIVSIALNIWAILYFPLG